MMPTQVLFVLSADFGEYVTANLFARNQTFRSHFALPISLSPYLASYRTDVSTYKSLEHIKALVNSLKPAVVVLGSAYLFPVNQLLDVAQIADLLGFLRRQNVVAVTTDPWLRIWSLRPGSRLRIISVRLGGEDAEKSRGMGLLQARLEDVLSGLPHLFAVPLRSVDRRCLPFFNPRFVTRQTHPIPVTRAHDDWLFVLSREDFVFLAGLEKTLFFEALAQRIEDLLAEPRNRLTFVGPELLGQFLGRWQENSRVIFKPFCDVEQFESLIAGARVVVYWNMLSASLLYCLYHGVPIVFFGAGHQVKVCEGMYQHAIEHVYRNRTPALLDLAEPLVSRADNLIRQLGLERWLHDIRADYERLPSSDDVLKELTNSHGEN